MNKTLINAAGEERAEVFGKRKFAGNVHKVLLGKKKKHLKKKKNPGNFLSGSEISSETFCFKSFYDLRMLHGRLQIEARPDLKSPTLILSKSFFFFFNSSQFKKY